MAKLLGQSFLHKILTSGLTDADGSVNINIIGATITDIPASNIHIHYIVFGQEEISEE